MTEIDAAEVAFYPFDRVPDQAARGCQWEAEECGGADQYRAIAFRQVFGGEPFDFGLPPRFLGESPFGGMRQRFPDRRVPVAGQLRKQLVADPIAGEIGGR